MSQDEFTKLFSYMQGEFTDIKKGLENTATKSQVDVLTNTVDGLAGLIRDYQQEMLMIGHKVDRLEQWILKVAEATGVKLTS
jgi:hypothetical protein